MSYLRESGYWFVGLVVAAGIMSGRAGAEDAAGIKAEIAELRARVAAMDSARMAPAAGGDAESLTSMKKTAAISIGGEVTVDLLVVRRDDGDRDGDGDARDNGIDHDLINSTTFYTNDAYLSFAIKASRDMSLNILLDLDDMWERDGGGVEQDDLLEECYFLWQNIRGSGLNLAFGKKGVDYGMDDCVCITTSTNEAGILTFLDGREAVEAGPNAHAAVGTDDLPYAQPSDLFVMEAEYNYRDWGRLYFALFQNNESTGGGRVTRGMYEDRPDDNLLFNSFACKLELTPREGLMLQASMINWHLASMDDADVRLAAGGIESRGQATDSKTSISLGLTYDFKSIPFSVFTQYQHGWDWTYNRDVSADEFVAGVFWHATSALDFGFMVEWAWLDNAPGYDEEDYWHMVLGGTYTFENGIYYSLEYCHSCYDGDLNAAGGDVERSADMFGMRVGLEF